MRITHLTSVKISHHRKLWWKTSDDLVTPKLLDEYLSIKTAGGILDGHPVTVLLENITGKSKRNLLDTLLKEGQNVYSSALSVGIAIKYSETTPSHKTSSSYGDSRQEGGTGSLTTNGILSYTITNQYGTTQNFEYTFPDKAIEKLQTSIEYGKASFCNDFEGAKAVIYLKVDSSYQWIVNLRPDKGFKKATLLRSFFEGLYDERICIAKKYGLEHANVNPRYISDKCGF